MDAKQVIQQLGGFGRLKACVNARNFAKGENVLTFRYTGSKHSNTIIIKLNSMDLYDLEFVKIHGTKLKTVSKAEGVYCDSLIRTFEEHTGLYLSL